MRSHRRKIDIKVELLTHRRKGHDNKMRKFREGVVNREWSVLHMKRGSDKGQTLTMYRPCRPTEITINTTAPHYISASTHN